ncbi:MAG: hypothetical protein ACKOC5_16895 [Chloroflexota bacterium]
MRNRVPEGPRRRRERRLHGGRAWETLRRLVSWRVAAGAALVAVGLLLLGGLVFWITRPPAARRAQATAVLQILTAAPPTSTPSALTPSAEAFPSPPPGVLAIGAYVQVTGTGGTGLRLRQDPSLNGAVALVASEAEVFSVEQGPQEADGYTWWYLVGPFDGQRRGWAVVNYLQVVQNP